MVASESGSLGVKIMTVPLQLTLPSTAGSIESASTALVGSTGSANVTSRLVVVSPMVGSSGTVWVSATSTTVGGRPSTVLAR